MLTSQVTRLWFGRRSELCRSAGHRSTALGFICRWRWLALVDQNANPASPITWFILQQTSPQVPFGSEKAWGDVLGRFEEGLRSFPVHLESYRRRRPAQICGEGGWDASRE
jgi:hypothetical protein